MAQTSTANDQQSISDPGGTPAQKRARLNAYVKDCLDPKKNKLLKALLSDAATSTRKARYRGWSIEDIEADLLSIAIVA